MADDNNISIICHSYFLSNVFLKSTKRSCLLVGETSHLGVVLREQDGSDSPNS